MKKVAILFAIWMIVINVFAVIGLNRLNLKGDTAYDWIDPNGFRQEQQWGPVSLRAQWDSFWYTDIAENGYSFKGWGELSNIVFFPVYPLLLKIVSTVMLGNVVLAGWMVSAAFLLLALYYLFRLVKEFHPELDPYLPIVFLLIFPTAFFFNAVYTESTFLFFSVVTFYYALKKNFLAAGVFGLCAALTRVTGVLLFTPVLFEFAKDRNFDARRIFNVQVLPIFLIPVGLISFFLYHYLKFGNFLLFFKVESWWGRTFTVNESHFSLSSNPAIANLLLDVMFVAIGVVSIYYMFKRLRTSYALYTIATMIVALGTGTLMSIGRYISVLFPIYLFAASIKNKYVQQCWILVSILLLGLYTILFVNGYWAG